MSEKETPVAKCKIEEVLNPATIKLLKAAPEHEVNRALVLQAIKKPIPPEVKTYEQVKEWIENNITKAAGTVFGRGPSIVVAATVNHTDEEVGTCRYYARRTGNQVIEMKHDDLEELFKEAIDEEWTVQDLMGHVRQRVIDWGQEDPPEMDTGPMDYDDYDMTDTRNAEAQLSAGTAAAVNDQVREWLNRNHPGELEEEE